MQFCYRNINHVPALTAERDDLTTPAPLLLWFHGLGVDKDTHRAELQLLAEAGFLAVGIDAVGHGARRLPNLQELIDAPREQAFATAVDLATKTAAEVPAIIEVLISENVADANSR